MKVTPEAHLKTARRILRAAAATNGSKKVRLESLACAFRILAYQLETKTDDMAAQAQNAAATSKMPLLANLKNEPSLSDTIEAWDRHLADLVSQPDSASRRASLQWAKAVIQEMRGKEPTPTIEKELPFMTHWLGEPPGLFGNTLALWEQRLNELRTLPDSVVTRGAIEEAEQTIAMKKAER